ncbi:hypothetical protein As57867_004669, partial [Aphanomyces stellatus]
MRPLRTLHSLPGLKVLTNSLLASLPALANVFVLLMFCMLVFAILGMEIYRGDFHYRCRVTPFPVALPADGTWGLPPNVNDTYIAMVQTNPEQYRCLDPLSGTIWTQHNSVWDVPQDCFWPTDATEPIPMLCNAQPDVGRQCGANVCGSNYDSQGNPRFNYLALAPWDSTASGDDALFNSNLNYGLTSFDNLGRTWVIILQTITASGWMVLTQTAQTTGSPVVGAIYFTALMYMGMCFLLQLNMAVLFTEFEKAKEQQSKLVLEERERKLRLLKAGTTLNLKSHKFPSIGRLIVTRVTLVANRHGHDATPSMLGRHYIVVQSWVHRIVVSKHFTHTGLAVTMANILVLAMDHHDIDAPTKNIFETANFAFMLYFGLESMLKIVGLGVGPFWKDKFNRFDLLTFVIGVVDTSINPPSFIDGTPGTGGFFTAFRAARAFKLARAWQSLNQLISAILNSLGEILNFLLFLLLFMLIFSLVGMEFFATRFQFDPNNYYMPYNNTNNQTRLHRSNFDSLPWAAFTIFQYLTYDNFPAVMYDGWISVGAVSPVFASLVIISGVFIVMNMFSAILVQAVMDGGDDGEDNDDDDRPPSEAKAAAASFVGDLSQPPPKRTRRESVRTKSVRAARRAMHLLVRINNIVQPHDPVEAPPQRILGRSLLVFSMDNPIRRFCIFLLGRREYTWVMSLSILVSCIGTALDSPLLDNSSGIGFVLEQSNLVFAVLFSTEMGLNVIARGFLFGPDAFVKDAWRLLDGFIVFVSILPYCMGKAGKGALSALRSLRALRALRPLRLINKLPSLKIVINTLFRCIPDMGRALLFMFFMLFLFGLMSLALFKGALYTCSVSPYNYGLGTGT